MNFSALSAAHQMIVRLALEGGPQYSANMNAAAASTKRLAGATGEAAVASETFTKKTFLQNQVLFTGRRLLFYTTLGLLGVGAALVKMGFSYQNTMQQARVALKPMFTDTVALSDEMKKLFSIAALTPFQFKDIVLGFTQLLKSGNLGAPKVNDTVQAISDILSATPGRATANNLNRVTTALSHMVNLGKPVGQLRLQLARLGIPLDLILRKELHATTQQLDQLSKSGFTSVQVLNALIKASREMPRFRNQALLSQLGTLSGVMSTFKDFLSQAAAGSTSGLFGGVFGLFRNVDIQLGKMSATGKNLSLTNIVKVFDTQLTPKSHLVINAFVMLTGLLQGLIYWFKAFGAAVYIALKPFELILGVFGHSTWAAKGLGVALGFLIGYWVTLKTVVILAREAQALYNWTVALGIGLAKTYTVMTRIMSIAMWGSVRASNGQFVAMTRLEKVVLTLRRAFIGLSAAELLAFGIYGLIAALVIGIVILYFKWKPFHDLVNNTFQYIMDHSKMVAAALIIAFGPIGLALAALELIIRYHKEIASWTGNAAHTAANPGHEKSNFDLRFPGLRYVTHPWNPKSVLGDVGSIFSAEPASAATIPVSTFTGDSTDRPIHIYMQVDRKTIAKAVVHANQDKKARK